MNQLCTDLDYAKFHQTSKVLVRAFWRIFGGSVYYRYVTRKLKTMDNDEEI